MKFTQGNFCDHVMIGRDFVLTAAKIPVFALSWFMHAVACMVTPTPTMKNDVVYFVV